LAATFTIRAPKIVELLAKDPVGVGRAIEREQHRGVQPERHRQQFMVDRTLVAPDAHRIDNRLQSFVKLSGVDLCTYEDFERIGAARIVGAQRRNVCGRLARECGGGGRVSLGQAAVLAEQRVLPRQPGGAPDSENDGREAD
jgi:hypothetical protein